MRPDGGEAAGDSARIHADRPAICHARSAAVPGIDPGKQSPARTRTIVPSPCVSLIPADRMINSSQVGPTVMSGLRRRPTINESARGACDRSIRHAGPGMTGWAPTVPHLARLFLGVALPDTQSFACGTKASRGCRPERCPGLRPRACAHVMWHAERLDHRCIFRLPDAARVRFPDLRQPTDRSRHGDVAGDIR